MLPRRNRLPRQVVSGIASGAPLGVRKSSGERSLRPLFVFVESTEGVALSGVQGSGDFSARCLDVVRCVGVASAYGPGWR